MTEVVKPEDDADQKEDIRECRACLRPTEGDVSACFIFQSWIPSWPGMEASIAKDLAKLANVEISETDKNPKIICGPCYQRLLDAATFASNVRVSDNLLKQRYTSMLEKTDKIWPKPIQIDKNLSGDILQKLDIEIKQEIIDEDYGTIIPDNSYGLSNSDAEHLSENLDIKTEPDEYLEPETEEYAEPPPLSITINETVSLHPSSNDHSVVLNGFGEYKAIITDSMQTTSMSNNTQSMEDESCLEPTVKTEPLSDDEDSEQNVGMSLDCLLCAKPFNSITGLKAHVIAHHSYKSVKRKSESCESPKTTQRIEYRCEICQRAFSTSTDLMVHETCHNKYSCYGCSHKYDTFKQLSKHRKKCTAALNKTVLKLKTLDDVIRTKEEKMDVESNQEVSKYDNSMDLLLEINSNKKTIKKTESGAVVGDNSNKRVVRIRKKKIW